MSNNKTLPLLTPTKMHFIKLTTKNALIHLYYKHTSMQKKKKTNNKD